MTRLPAVKGPATREAENSTNAAVAASATRRKFISNCLSTRSGGRAVKDSPARDLPSKLIYLELAGWRSGQLADEHVDHEHDPQPTHRDESYGHPRPHQCCRVDIRNAGEQRERGDEEPQDA